jgi:hypothetical protein
MSSPWWESQMKEYFMVIIAGILRNVNGRKLAKCWFVYR